MFVYLLITAELAVLYTVFWYLYVREPKYKRHIAANMWGTYEESLTRDGADPTLPFIQGSYEHQLYEAYCRGELCAEETNSQEEFVWDSSSNHYVPVSQLRDPAFLTQMAAKLDQTFSQLNVRP